MSCVQPYMFVSVPRAASRSIHRMLGLSRVKDRSDRSDCGILDNHAPASVLRERYGTDDFERRFKFAFIRNPWDRAVSWFFYHASLAPYRHHTFDSWILAGMPHHWTVQNETVYSQERTPLRQLPFIADDSGSLLVDFVGHVESLAADMHEVACRLGLRDIDLNVWINRARRVDYRLYYTDETAEFLGRQLAADVSALAYRFDT